MKELEGMKFPENSEEMMLEVKAMTPIQKEAMLLEMVWHSYHPPQGVNREQIINKAYHSAVLIPC